MPPAKPALKIEPKAAPGPGSGTIHSAPPAQRELPHRLPSALAGVEQARRPVPVSPPARLRRENASFFQARVPVITGEATYRGSISVDGTISGQLGANASALVVKQRPRNGPVEVQPELDGEIGFKDMLRVNGHIAGKVFSFKGTLIIDASAKVDGQIDVAVCVISGTVNGDVVGHERVELGAEAVIHGNISTRLLAVKPGAIFDGDCRMLKDENGDK